MNNLPELVERTIVKRGLLRRGQRVLVGVSGGVDSMVLLHVLDELSRKNSWRLTVAHLNHRLRGRAADADERLAARTARKLHLAFISRQADVKSVARSGKQSLEMAARTVRHEFLASTAIRLGIHTVALAHHADDQVELFFLRLLRGAGGEGLSGMKWKSPSPNAPAVTLVRPLLDQPKAILRDYAGEHAIRFREDASNASLDFQRNRVRHELLPLLRRNYQPSLDQTILRFMGIVGAESEFVASAAEAWLRRRKRVPFGRLAVAVQRACVRLQLLREKVAFDYELIERLREEPSRPVSIAPNRSVVRDGAGALHLVNTNSEVKPGEYRRVELAQRVGTLTHSGISIRWRMERHTGKKTPPRVPAREYFDADKVGSRILLRHWRPGDRFQPIGMSSPVKLQDLFTNSKIPRAQRHTLIVAEAASGELFWVERLRMAERFKLCNGTIRRLRWEWKRL